MVETRFLRGHRWSESVSEMWASDSVSLDDLEWEALTFPVHRWVTNPVRITMERLCEAQNPDRLMKAAARLSQYRMWKSLRDNAYIRPVSIPSINSHNDMMKNMLSIWCEVRFIQTHLNIKTQIIEDDKSVVDVIRGRPFRTRIDRGSVEG